MDKMLYQIMKMQVLTASLTEGPAEHISDAYVYAWAKDLYPIPDSTEIHKPFAACFAVSQEMMEALINDLDARFREGKFPSFRDIESSDLFRFGDWDRPKLISALRYFYLWRSFNDEFWNKIVSEAPVEAHGINNAFVLSDDVCLP